MMMMMMILYHRHLSIKSMTTSTMHKNLIITFMLTMILYNVSPASSEMEYFPGLRRPPNWSQSQAANAEETNDFLAQIIEEQARRRFQQQLLAQQQQHYYQIFHQKQQQHQQKHGPNANENYHQNHIVGNTLSSASVGSAAIPSFTYSFSSQTNHGQSHHNSRNINNNENSNGNDDIIFAVNPSDPRYYDNNDDVTVNSNKLNSLQLDNKNNDNNNNNEGYHHQREATMKINGNIVPYSRLKSPMEINSKTVATSSSSFYNNNVGGVRHDINDLVNKLEREGQVNAIINDNGHAQHRNDVIKKHMGIEGEMGMYVVALIAGVSAAITVGLIALGIGWYTLQKRTKAAADVDYPAYGVTGPNKDISPSGDRRLAQSAQMYHYQHQKQQIIAMENRNTGEHNGGISDVESDDDNDEGDYTVYECPGLAPTGEMEVKNPLFLDDTPVTPSTNLVDGQNQQSHPRQQQQQQKQEQQQQQKQEQQQPQQQKNQQQQPNTPSAPKSAIKKNQTTIKSSTDTPASQQTQKSNENSKKSTEK